MEIWYQNLKNSFLRKRQDSIIKDYYSKEIYKGKSYKAVYFDKIAFVLFVFLFLSFLLWKIINAVLLSIFISLILVFFITKKLISFRDTKQKKEIDKVKEDLKSKRILRELSQLNREEFVDYIKAILEKYYQSEFIYGEDGIDLIGKIQSKTYAVKCIKSTMEDKIIRKKVIDFNNYIDYLDYDEGIIATNSYFQNEIKEHTSLILFDFTAIKEILINIDEYPKDEEINNYIRHRYKDKKQNIRDQMRTINIKKIIKLYGVFIIFYTISFFMNYSNYYKVMAILSFALATVLGGIKITEHVKLKGKNSLHE